MNTSRAPGGSMHDHENAMKWARRWSRSWNTRYQVRWIKASGVWHVYPTDKPAPRRKPSSWWSTDLGPVTVTHWSHDFQDPHRCAGCGEHPTLTWAHTDEWYATGKCVDCLMIDLQRNAA